MNVVIYTRDMEPITVIDLPLWALEFGERQAFVRVALEQEVRLVPLLHGHAPIKDTLRVVTLEFVPIRLRHGLRNWLIMTDDDELALALRPSWLPGQRRKINGYERANRELSAMLLNVLARGMGGH